jgi:hypothetical protein
MNEGEVRSASLKNRGLKIRVMGLMRGSGRSVEHLRGTARFGGIEIGWKRVEFADHRRFKEVMMGYDEK